MEILFYLTIWKFENINDISDELLELLKFMIHFVLLISDYIFNFATL